MSNISQRFAMITITCMMILTLMSFRSFAYYPKQDYKGEKPCTLFCRPEKSILDGLYVGAALGYDSYKVRQSISVVDTAGHLDQANPEIAARGLISDIFVGYGRYFDWFYIGGEIFGNYSNANSNFVINNYNSSFAARSGYGLSLLPGLKLNRLALLYLRLGYVRTFQDSKESGVLAGNEDTTQWGNGINLGLGLETPIYGRFSLRGEYNYIFYGSYSSFLGTTFSPSNSQFMLGVLYHFC